MKCNECRNKNEQRVAGIGFLRTQRSESIIMDMAEEMIGKAWDEGVELIEVFVDRSGRPEPNPQVILKIREWMTKPYIQALVLRDINEIAETFEDGMLIASEAIDNMVDICIVSLPWAEFPEDEVFRARESEEYVC